MVEQSSKAIASFLLKEQIIKEEDQEVYEYGVKHILINAIMFLCMGVIGLVTNAWMEMLFFFIGFLPLRVTAGGYHSKTSQRCSVLSVIVLIANIFIVRMLMDRLTMISLILFVSVILLSIFVFSPVDHKNRKYNYDQFRKAKIKSWLAVVLLATVIIGLARFGLMNHVSCLGIMMGALTGSISTIIGDFIRGGEQRYEREISA